MMTDPFRGTRLKIKRAERHIAELEAEIDAFLRTDFGRLVPEQDAASRTYGLRFVPLKPLPDTLPLIIGDAIHNLRASLDILVTTLVKAADGQVGEARFPFHETYENVAADLRREPLSLLGSEFAKWCLDSVRPYRTGNFALWAMNKLDVLDKHRLPIPVLTVTEIQIHAKDDLGNQITMKFLTDLSSGAGLFTFSEPYRLESEPRACCSVLFSDKQFLAGRPVIPTLRKLAEDIVAALEALEATDWHDRWAIED